MVAIDDIPQLRRLPGAAKHVRGVLKFLFWLLTRPHIAGLENLPADGPYLIVANHLSRFDPPFGFIAVDHPKLTGFAANTYRKHWFFRTFLEAAGVIWVDRGNTDRATIRAALEALQQGAIFGIAPEGRRSQTGALIKGKTGAAYLAAKANVLVVPAAFTNTENIAREWRRLRRPRITLTFGKPFTLPPFERMSPGERLERYTDEIMCRIAALLPEKYRGEYANHPRLKELLGLTPGPSAEGKGVGG